MINSLISILLPQPISVTEDGDEHVWHIAITAYVTIALSEAARLTGVSVNHPSLE